MKKYFLGVFTLLLIACSDDNTNPDTNLSENKIENLQARSGQYDEVYINQIFNNYVNSSDFKTLKFEKQRFYKKFKNLNQLSHINSEAELKTWIGNNIGQTSFVSIDEAIQSIDLLNSLTRNVVKKFPEIFEFIALAPEATVDLTLIKWLGETKSITTNYSCEDKLKFCEQSAWSDYRRQTSAAYRNYGLSNEQFSDEMRFIDDRFERAIFYCGSDYEDCIGA